MTSCAFCGRKIDLDDAVEEGWTPSFWITGIGTKEKECLNPACPSCSKYHLKQDSSGEFVVKMFHKKFLKKCK